MNNLRLWANYYYNMGFNVTHIIPELNEGKAKNPYKSPTNDRFKIANIRQSLEEMQSFDWENSKGIGVVLGFNNLRALDFDFHPCGLSRLDYNKNLDKVYNKYYKSIDAFIQHTISLLGLPNEYEWVVKTPNNGFHIIFYSGYHNFMIKDELTKALTPNILVHDLTLLKSIELRWNKHLVLPPSIGETERMEIKNYVFFKKIPTKPPVEIKISSLYEMLNEYCYDEYESLSGYNLHLSQYYKDNNENTDFLEYYSFGEFLDFSPVYFKKNDKEEIGIPDNWLKD